MFHPTVHSYFSGAGLMDAGLICGGLPITRSFELDARACKVQRDNLGHHVENVDISRLCVTGQGEADVIIGTYVPVMVVVKPVVHSVGINPEGEGATVDQRLVVLRPVGDGVKRHAHDVDLKGMVVIRSPASQLVPFKLHQFG